MPGNWEGGLLTRGWGRGYSRMRNAQASERCIPQTEGEGTYLNEWWKLNSRLRSRPQTEGCGSYLAGDGEEATGSSWVATERHNKLL